MIDAFFEAPQPSVTQGQVWVLRNQHLTAVPLAVSITEGVAFGLLSYVVLKTATGRRREVHPLIVLFAALLLARYVFLR